MYKRQASTGPKSGVITATTITGFAMAAAGITYRLIEALFLALGSGDDTVRIDSTHDGAQRTTDVITGAGNDTVIIRSVSGPLHVKTQGGDDTVRISSTQTGAGGTLAQIAALVTLDGGDGTDRVFFDNTANLAGVIGTLTNGLLTGLGMSLGGSAARPDLVQVVSIGGARDGRFTITVAGFGTTAALDFDATAAQVQAALATLVGAGNVAVVAAGQQWVIHYTGLFAGEAGWAHPVTAVTASTTYPLVRVDGSPVAPTYASMTDGLITYTGFQSVDASLGQGADTLLVDSTITGTTTVNAQGGDDRIFVRSVSGPTFVNGGAGNDWLLLNQNPPPLGTPNPLDGQTITLDGGANSDTTVVNLFGNGNSRINVVDTVADGATNVLVISGTAGNDTFLGRANAAKTGLIALLSGASASGFTSAEKVTYTSGINGGVVLNGGNGDDTFALDNTASALTVNGGAGNDRFQVGQLFNRYTADAEFAAAATFSSSRGWLSSGVDFPATLNGGAGDDTFQIFRNVASLQLNGDAGDDTFIVRSFIADSEVSSINAGEGRDSIQYAVNAPVAIDGGTGYDQVVVIGTEANDTYVITRGGVYGAGRFVTYTAVEQLRVYGMAGNDTFLSLIHI